MPKITKLEADGSLTVTEDTGGGSMRQWSIQSDQIAAHQLDATVDAVIAPNDKIKIRGNDALRKLQRS